MQNNILFFKITIGQSCEISKAETYDREVGTFEKFLAANLDYKGVLITIETEKTISVKSGKITVLPVWKWLLANF